MGLALASGTAMAQDLHSFEDDDLDFLLRNGDYINPLIDNTPFQVGDVLFSVFEIPTYTVNGVNAIPAGQELTGVAAVQIQQIIGNGTNPGDQLIFGAADLDGILAANGFGGGALGNGAAIAMWFNGAPGGAGDIDLKIGKADGAPTGNPNCTGIADCINQATQGNLFQVDGFLGDPDEFWTSTLVVPGGGTTATVLDVGNSTVVAAFNAAISNIFHAGAAVGLTDLNGVFCGENVDIVIQAATTWGIPGSITNPGPFHGAFAHSDFDIQKYTVPEPSVMMLLSVGLLGFGAAARRQN